MAKTFRELTLTHPYFSVGDRVNKGRAHLPVSLRCDICYRLYNRKTNGTDIRPGVTSIIITPQGTVGMVRRAMELCPNITAARIAGPSDTLATPYALETFRFIKQEFPNVIKCISTNGLLPPRHAQEIIGVGIDTLTVTVNTLDPEIQTQICSGIVYHGKRYEGVEVAGILIENQLKGIEIVSEADITVKVNTVLTLGINADHVGTAAQTVAETGTRIYNIIPLTPRYELSWYSVPGCAVLNQARCETETYIDMFRHCQHCRTDAVGIPGGEDFIRQIYTRPVVQQNTFSHR